MRMNREDLQNPKIKVRKHCANYDTGYNCSGIMINRKLQQWVDLDLCNKECLINQGKSCDYFTNIVEPALKEK
tara:strand:+ start:533 stop:751 length:219 start_codon:yes stop_codon:yes gene_type:complete